jgi:hypothetical protein
MTREIALTVDQLREIGRPVLEITIAWFHDVVYRVESVYYGHSEERDIVGGPFPSLQEAVMAMNFAIEPITTRVISTEWTPPDLIEHLRIDPAARGQTVWFNDQGWEIPKMHLAYTRPLLFHDLRTIVSSLATSADTYASQLANASPTSPGRGMANADAARLKKLSGDLEHAPPDTAANLLESVSPYSYSSRLRIQSLIDQIRTYGLRP